MSGSNTLTIAAPPLTQEAAADVISWMAGQSGIITDYNTGSQIRTNAEAIASVLDMQGIISQAMAFQALVYAAFSAFNVFPLAAQGAVGTVTFTTGSGASPPPAQQPVIISAGTLVSTIGGTQFQTTASVTLQQGLTSVTAIIEATTPGVNGNVAAGTITQIVTGIGYPLAVSNATPTAGGSDAETPAQTMARFTATVAALGLSTPVSIANACIGVTASGTSEIIKYSTVYEPWIAFGLTGTAGYRVFIDNGSGAASNQLITAVIAKLSGDQTTGDEGYRPAGVPYSVEAVTPVLSSVVVSGTAIVATMDSVLTSAASAAIISYYQGLQFGAPAELSQLSAAVANSVAGYISSLSVALLDANNNPQSVITPASYQRMLLSSSNVAFN